MATWKCIFESRKLYVKVVEFPPCHSNNTFSKINFSLLSAKYEKTDAQKI